MQPPPDELLRRLTALRRAFDESFAASPRPHKPAAKVLLAIRTGSIALAVRLQDLAGVHASRKIVPLPNKGALLGIAGLRGNLLAIYDLAALLGAASTEKQLRWWLATAADPHTAFAVETLEAYIEADESQISPVRAGDDRQEHVQETVQHEGIAWGVVSLSSILGAVQRLAARSERPGGFDGT